VIAMTLAQVAAAIGIPAPDGATDLVVRSVEFDTRRITPGALFVALRGERTDGHALAESAAQAGAVAVLADGERPWYAGAGIVTVREAPARQPAALVSRRSSA
jgi:UDP-N-acetylmuramoyl-tripeptide--D-alanyl-D-alanine ligase